MTPPAESARRRVPLWLLLAGSGLLVTGGLLVSVLRRSDELAEQRAIEALAAGLGERTQGGQPLWADPAHLAGGERLLDLAARLDGLSLQAGLVIGARPALVLQGLANPASEAAEAALPLGEGETRDLPGALRELSAALDPLTPALDEALSGPVSYPCDLAPSDQEAFGGQQALIRLSGALVVRAAFLAASRRGEEAWRDVLRLARLAGTRRGPNWIEQLGQAAQIEQCSEAVEDLLSALPPPAPPLRAELEEALAALGEFAGPARLADALRYELAFVVSLSERPATLDGVPTDDAAVVASWGSWRLSYAGSLAGWITAAEEARASQAEAWAERQRRLRTEVNLFHLRLPNLGTFLQRVAVCQVRIRLARTALTLAARDALPETWDQLPPDPFRADGGPCRYRAGPEGALLWSVGLDGSDQGGLPVDPRALDAPHDLSLRFSRPPR